MPPVHKTRDAFVTRSAAKRTTSAAAAPPNPATLTRKPATTFKSFSRLPPEIQLKIWEIAIQGYDGRIVQINVKSLLTKYSEHVRGILYSSPTPIPGMLHACSDAREIALKRYQLALSSFASKGPRTYVDYHTDTIYFGEALLLKPHSFALSMLLRDLDDDDIAKIRKLGMAQKLWNYQTFCNLHVLVDFPALEQVTLTMERPAAAGRSGVGKSAEFVPVKKNEEFYTCISHHGIMDDPDDLMIWPEEVEEILTDHLEEPYETQGLLDKMPTLEFKMLCDKSKRKSPAKGKGKSK